MLQSIKSTVKSREFQSAVLHGAGMIATLVVTSVVSQVVNKGIDTGIEKLMDKIHGTENTAAG